MLLELDHSIIDQAEDDEIDLGNHNSAPMRRLKTPPGQSLGNLATLQASNQDNYQWPLADNQTSKQPFATIG